jgi:hypothetical protein
MSKLTLALALVVTIVGVCPSARAQRPTSATERGLVGSWILVKAERVDGATPVPLPNPRGLIVFDSAGHVLEIVTQGGRQTYAVTNRPTPEEALAAFNTFQGFWGTYRQDEKTGAITYHPEGAVNPSLMGLDLVRRYELKGDRLVITSQPGESNVQGTRRWTWERVLPIENLPPAYRKFIGFWQVVGDKIVSTATGETLIDEPRDPSTIVYAPSGFIGVLFSPPNRKRLSAVMATPEEAKADIAGYVGYIAVLSVHPPSTAFHHQIVTIAPGGADSLERLYELVGNEIHLNFLPVIVNGREQQTRVTLRRLTGEAEMLGK